MNTSQYVSNNLPVPAYFKAYGSEVDWLCDEDGNWYWLEIGSINYDKSTFKYRVFRWAKPYTTVEWLTPSVTLYHAKFAIGKPVPSLLWLFGLDANNQRWIMDVPGFATIPNQYALRAVVSVEIETQAAFMFPGGRMLEARGFVSNAPVGANKSLGTLTRRYRQYQINRIAKRHGINT
jgi:hypothetical protein